MEAADLEAGAGTAGGGGGAASATVVAAGGAADAAAKPAGADAAKPPDPAAAAAATTTTTSPATTTTGGLRLRLRRPTICNPAHRLYESRPDVVHQKTRKEQWRQLRSRWRFAHSVLFWAGPPAFLLSRVWPVIVVNMLLAGFVAADHIVRALHRDGARDTLLPNITDNVIESVTPMSRFMLFAASMLLTLRLGRAYERWWAARQAFSNVGSTATALAQRFTLWVGDRDPLLAADLRRWAVAWHWSIHHVCRNASSIHPEGAKMLTPEEMAIYAPARKGRQICVDKLVELITRADLEEKKFTALEALLQRGVAAAGVCTGVRFQSLPYALTLVSTGFVELFLVTLVMLMVQTSQPNERPDRVDDTIFTVVVVLVLYLFINLLFLGSDEVASQLEDPFPWLPLEDIAETTGRDVMRVPDEMRALRRADEARAARMMGMGMATTMVAVGSADDGGAARGADGGGGGGGAVAADVASEAAALQL